MPWLTALSRCACCSAAFIKRSFADALNLVTVIAFSYAKSEVTELTPFRASQSQSAPVGASREISRGKATFFKVKKFYFLCWLNFKYFEGFEV
jgi:hypothetical protein